MSLEVISLSQLLQIIYASEKRQKVLLYRKIYSEKKKASGESTSTGGDFYAPFWADAKRHVAGNIELRAATLERIAKSKGVERLYKELTNKFLLWWEERRRLRNEPFTIIPESIKARFQIEGLGTIKVENTLSITVGDDGHRIFYPYLCEEPALSEEAARLSLFVMSQSIDSYALKDMRILDVMRAQSFSVVDTPLQGNEEELLREKYRGAVDAFSRLREKYQF